MIKKILLSLATIFLIWQSYDVLSVIDKIEIKSVGSLIFIAWIINLYITGIFAFSGFALPTQKIIPDTYYKIYQPKRLKKLYKVLRVDLFRKMLLATFWKNRKQRKRFFDGKKGGIPNLIKQSKKSEFGHLVPFIIICLICIWLAVIGHIELSICTFFINFVGNFYPIILQRHHRMRIQAIWERMK